MNSGLSGGLVLLLFLAVAETKAETSEHAFVGVRKCGTCHTKTLIGNQVGTWKKHAHASAYAALDSDRSRELARAAGLETAPQEAAECLRCHVTGYGADPKRLPRGRVILKDGVGCESCHGAGRDYRKNKTMSDRDAAVAKGMKIPAEEECLRCHNSESPTWDAERYTRADGSRAGFDFKSGWAAIEHSIPADVKGRYLELKKSKKKNSKKE